MVREVMDDAARDRLVDNVVGHLLNGVTEPVLQRAFEYWRNVDKDLGDRIEQDVRAKQDEKDPKAAEQGNPARRACRTRPDVAGLNGADAAGTVPAASGRMRASCH